MSTDSVEPVKARKEKIREGYKVHLRKLILSVNHLLRDTDSAENTAELLLRNLQFRNNIGNDFTIAESETFILL